MSNIQWNTIPVYIYALYATLVLCTLVQLYYYLVHFGRVIHFGVDPDRRKDGVQQPVSVVMRQK